jgi:sugar transferase (PEP-CTERM system associated)
VIRLFHVYYSIRQLVLLAGEALVVWTSFLLGMVVQYRSDSYLVLNYEYGYYKILLVTAIALLFLHWFDLYDPAYFNEKGELYFRLLAVPGILALILAITGYAFPWFLPGNNSALTGLIILTLSLFVWRAAYSWLVRQPFLRERVYVLGTGERAQRLVNGLRARPDLGVDVVGWSGSMEGALTPESITAHLAPMVEDKHIHRVVVAMPDRRGTLPVQELLRLRLGGIKIEEATSWLERMSGQIEVENLYPSWLIFAEGFRFTIGMRALRRLLSILASAALLIVVFPLIPLVVLAIKLGPPGPVLYRQKRVGRNGVVFYCYKFRTMRRDAEADTGPTWAGDDDPRITPVGKFLRITRLDEIPQLWCVLKGDMAFVGPRPERPEFMEWLTREIPYYPVRLAVRPGITGWAQIRYRYGNTTEHAREKLQYDLFYIKNASIGLDVLIMFETIKIVLLGRGAQ